MGIYLSSPKTEKTIEKGESSQCKWVAAGMQGFFNFYKGGVQKWKIVTLPRLILSQMFQFSEFLTVMGVRKWPYMSKNILFQVY